MSNTNFNETLKNVTFAAMTLQTALKQQNISLVAVSKTYPSERILEEYNAGQRIFGENKVQELVAKYEALPKDIQWHFIGHLQRNKVKYIAPFIDMIHGIDSYALLEEIDKQAQKHDRVVQALLQFHIAQEDTKFGFSETEAMELLENMPWNSFQNVRICGVMGMASYTDDAAQVRKEFDHLKQIFDRIKQRFFANNAYFKEVSMGMSGDWEIAVSAGSTMVRIGSLIFGRRN